ncbi:MAG: signal peptide peptidase SppA [Deltaproteobacteria bacterium]|nr:signal peptide peptidase SppA [Deltaproteobacteria bacterium]HCH65186.1 signal peptide peptidase SppA [Deltaproteobacteria bacterium]
MLGFVSWLIKFVLVVPCLGLLGLWDRLRVGRKAVLRVSLGPASARPQDRIGDVPETVALLRAVRDDPSVRAVVIDVRNVPGGQAALQDLRATMLELRSHGRTVLVHVHGLSWRELMVASAADRVWMSPAGEVFLTGLGARLTYYGPALEKVGLEADLVSVGRFKTFGEPYLRGHPSRANREQLGELLGDLQAQIVEYVSEGRGLDPESLLTLLGRAPLSADDALRAGLVDDVLYPDASSDAARELLGEGLRVVPARAYKKVRDWQRRLRLVLDARPSLAVVHLDGPIVQGQEGSSRSVSIDSDQVVPVLRSLGADPTVRGVVLAVNSPGGSALASDLIARAVQCLGTQKPVVAAFGDVAASGGYYLSAPASEIVARDGTVTGSIGVVGGKVVVGRALARLGIHSESVDVGPDAGFLGPFEPFDGSQRKRFQASLERAYVRFLSIVSAGRRRPVRAIEPFAAGRVWTGRQALDRGLVDHLGGLDVAIERVAVKASVSPSNVAIRDVRFRPSRFLFLSQLMQTGIRGLVRDGVREVLLERMGAGGHILQHAWRKPNEPLALLPWDIDT